MLSAGREFRHRAARRGFGHLPAGVGIDLRVEHQHVDVARRSPARDRVRRRRCRTPSRRRPPATRSCAPACRQPPAGRAPPANRAPASFCFSSATRFALRFDAGLLRLIRFQQALHQSHRRAGCASASSKFARIVGLLDPPPAACPGQTRRCLQTANWTRPARAPANCWCTESSADCRRKSKSSRWHSRSAGGRRKAA